MDLNLFIDALGKHYGLNFSQKQFLYANLIRWRCKHGTPLLDIGEVPKRLYFLDEGLVRGYYSDRQSGREITAWFCYSLQLVGNIQDFVWKRKSEEAVQTISPCTLYYIEDAAIRTFLHQQPDLGPLYNRLLKEYLQLVNQRKYCTDGLRSEDKILRFKEVMPRLIYQLNQKHLASYLGMSRGRLNTLLQKKFH